MNNDFHHIDLDHLIEFYKKEAAELKAALLNGALWHEVREKRILVTQLAMAIQQKKTSSNPAEESLRQANEVRTEELPG